MVWKSDMPNEEPLDSRDFFLNDDPVSDSGEYSMVNTSNNFGNRSYFFNNALLTGFVHFTDQKHYFKS